jgi:hypothetical protein
MGYVFWAWVVLGAVMWISFVCSHTLPEVQAIPCWKRTLFVDIPGGPVAWLFIAVATAIKLGMAIGKRGK